MPWLPRGWLLIINIYGKGDAIFAFFVSLKDRRKMVK